MVPSRRWASASASADLPLAVGPATISAVAGSVVNDEPMITLNADILRRIVPAVSGTKATTQAAIIDAVGALVATCADYAVDTALRSGHFRARVRHEAEGFCTTQEYADGSAYEGHADLGNTQPDDGPRFKRRGLFQLTGRANYTLYGDILDVVSSAKAALGSAVANSSPVLRQGSSGTDVVALQTLLHALDQRFAIDGCRDGRCIVRVAGLGPVRADC